MKKTTLIALSISAFFLISCKKDRVCSCTYADGSVATQVTFVHVTKKEAKSSCVSSTSGVTCTVK